MPEVEEYFREIRSLLHGEPNEHNFKQVCTLLEDALRNERERAASELVPYAGGMMRLWPHRLRRMPTSWLKHIGDRIPWHVSTLQPLMRTILIDNREVVPADINKFVSSELFDPILRLEFQYVWGTWNRTWESYSLDTELVRQLLGSERFLRLEELEITRCIKDPKTYALLATSEHMRGIRALTLRKNRAIGLEALASAEHLEGLEELDLGHTPCGHSSSRSCLGDYLFEQTSKLVSIERLFLRNCDANNKDMEALASAPFIQKLTHLDLRDNKNITAKGLEAVLSACQPGQLKSLDLSNTRLGGKGLKILAKSEALTNLELLRIHNVGSTEAGERAMANSTTLPEELTESFRE